jgi:hypothetical protein
MPKRELLVARPAQRVIHRCTFCGRSEDDYGDDYGGRMSQYRGFRIVVPILVLILVPIIVDQQRSGRGSGQRFRSTKIVTMIATKIQIDEDRDNDRDKDQAEPACFF